MFTAAGENKNPLSNLCPHFETEVNFLNETSLLFCGKSPKFLIEKLTAQSTAENGGEAFRIPSLINADGVLVAAADRASSGADWGYIEIAVRRSEDLGKTWSALEVIAAPPARETRISDDCFSSGFYIDPCMAIAPNGDIIMLVDFWPECKGLHDLSKLEKHKPAYRKENGETLFIIYDKSGRPYYVKPDGEITDADMRPTEYSARGLGGLYKGDEYLGNIFLDGVEGENEMCVELTHGAPLKAVKRCYVFMFRSADKGKTWSGPKDITGEILLESDSVFLGVAPGVGLTTESGRIIMPLYAIKHGSAAVYSDDNGISWKRSEKCPYAKNTGEWQLIEAKGGAVIGLGRQKRYGKTPVCISEDGGESWKKLKKSKLNAPKCQKSVITAGDLILCSHASARTRKNGMLSKGRLCYRNGVPIKIDWFSRKPINKGFFAYSCLSPIDEKTIGVLYESQPSSYIEFGKFEIGGSFGKETGRPDE